MKAQTETPLQKAMREACEQEAERERENALLAKLTSGSPNATDTIGAAAEETLRLRALGALLGS